MNNLAILLTSHNRKEKTLKCLEHLLSQNGIEIDFNIFVFWVNDGCTDGTQKSIEEHYPNVVIIKGNGNLFWNRGMHLAWQSASEFREFDYYLLLNDDTYLHPNAIFKLLKFSDSKSIVGGSTFCEIKKKVSYGGFINDMLVSPNEVVQYVDYLNGNCMLVPNEVYKRIGQLDDVFQHALGDFDYTLRAKKKGIKLKLIPGYVGLCDSNFSKSIWMDSSFGLLDRIKFLNSPLSGCQFPEYFIFEFRHKGFLMAIFHFFSIHMKVIFPEIGNIFKSTK